MVGYKRKIIGRSLDLNESAPSFKNHLLKVAAGEYKVGNIVPHLQYLISEEPINELFWRNANYDDLEFKYKGENIVFITNHGSEDCMNAVLNGKLDISDWILDLSHLLGSTLMKHNQIMEFKSEIQERTKNGIVRYVI